MLERSENPSPAGITLYELEHDYLDGLRSRNYSPRTVQKRRQALDLFVPWLKHSCEVLEPRYLQARHLETWQSHLFARRTARGYPLKPSSINSQTGSVQSFLAYLADRGHLGKSILRVLQRVKEPDHLPSNVLTHAQVRKLLNIINPADPTGFRDRALLEILYSTGIRAAELLALDIGDIQFEQGTALVHGKGNKDRMVPIGRTAMRYLESYVHAVRGFLIHDPSEPALFLNHRGQRLAYHNLRYMLRKYSQAARLDIVVTPHTFRRSCTTEMVRSGANLYHVKEMLGHATLKTMRHYVKLTIVDLKKTHEKCHPREKDS